MTTKYGAGSRRFPLIRNKVTEWYLSQKISGLSAEHVLRRLKAEPDLQKAVKKWPTARTIQRMLKELTVNDTSAEWDFGQYSAEDARLVLEILPQLAVWTDGKAATLTTREAASLLKVLKS